MKTETVNKYVCEICTQSYITSEEAMSCERQPVSQDKGVKIGDNIFIPKYNEIAKVIDIFILSGDHRYVFCGRYWHTIAIIVEFNEGGRILKFDEYVYVKNVQIR